MTIQNAYFTFNGREQQVQDFLGSKHLTDGNLSVEFNKLVPFVPPNQGLGGPECRFDIKVDGFKVGSINFTLTPEMETPTIIYDGHFGYFIQVQHRMKGYASRALRLLLPVVLNDFKMTPVYICTTNDNIASRRVMEKAGGIYRGYLKVPEQPEHTDLFREEGVSHTHSYKFE